MKYGINHTDINWNDGLLNNFYFIKPTMEKLQQIKRRKEMLAKLKNWKTESKVEIIERKVKKTEKMRDEYVCK